jgi:hypothetical protein
MFSLGLGGWAQIVETFLANFNPKFKTTPPKKKKKKKKILLASIKPHSPDFFTTFSGHGFSLSFAGLLLCGPLISTVIGISQDTS